MFRGINSVNLDAKGRIALPVRQRENLNILSGSNLVVTVDHQETCLLLYPLAEWERLQDSLMRRSNVRRKARQVQRMLLGYASDVEVDGNGRILIPPELRKYAGLNKRLILLGQGNKFEIWDDELWQQRMADWKSQQVDEDLDEEDFADLSI